MHLIVGLGNPGLQYERTRHNVGFLVVDRLAAGHAAGVSRGKFHGEARQGPVAGHPALLLKPMTFMNRSGLSVAEAMRFYKLEPAQLLVIVDDCALDVGRIRLRRGGGAGGHNGLADISTALGTEAYARLRIGIDPPGRVPRDRYVLGCIPPNQQPDLDHAVVLACDAVETWLNEGIESAMNRHNAMP